MRELPIYEIMIDLNGNYLKTKSNNARILSIGMPPRMIRNLIGEPTGYELNAADRARNNIVRLKIYKNDILIFFQ